MAFDYKKEYKEFYMPPKKPGIIEVPPMNYIAVRGKGDPNEENGEYKESIGLLYGIAFTIKMNYKGEHRIDGYFEYVMQICVEVWLSEPVICRSWLWVGQHIMETICQCMELMEVCQKL